MRLGRDYTPTYWNDNLFDPFGVNGVGTSLISTASGQTSPGSFKSGWSNGTVLARQQLDRLLPAEARRLLRPGHVCLQRSDQLRPGRPDAAGRRRDRRQSGAGSHRRQRTRWSLHRRARRLQQRPGGCGAGVWRKHRRVQLLPRDDDPPSISGISAGHTTSAWSSCSASTRTTRWRPASRPTLSIPSAPPSRDSTVC